MIYKLPFSIALLILGFVALFTSLVLFLEVAVTTSNASKYSAIGQILAATVGILALGVIGYQTMQLRANVNLQRNQIQIQTLAFELEHRPYLYLYLPTVGAWLNPSEAAWFGGGNLHFRNVGKDLATIVKPGDYMVASDRRGVIGLREWFEADFGGFPDISSVFPGQDDASVPCHPMISPGDKKPRLLYIGAVISYASPKKDRTYWYKFSQAFVIQTEDEKGRKLDPPVVHSLRSEHDWDRNMNSEPPKLSEPNWADYLSQPYIKKLTGDASQSPGIQTK